MAILQLALILILPTALPICAFLLLDKSDTFITKATNTLTLNPRKGLLHQKLFWLCIIIPILYFIAFGYIAWQGYSISLTADGLATFLSTSTLPLALLSTSLPLTVIVASFHSTHQTALQINQTKDTYELETSRKEQEEQNLLINTLKLIKTELKVGWDIYESEYAVDLKKLQPGQPYLIIFPLGSNLFPIYDSAPAHLANAPIEISEEIVRIYMRVKGLVTMINNNNTKTAAVHARAMNVFQTLTDQARKEKVDFTQDFTNHLQSRYEWHRDWEARTLDMGGDAESMKLLTEEIEQLLDSINTKLTNHIENYESLNKN
ncbi:hypothetical protein H7698_02055 [Pseudomonas sp. p50]|uniref:hypothetical protein n=1 Tax=Pseudomonas sp. p50(2008) TaxID=2816832 RepID=UPI00188B1864|nr:hypothetical protein [Pseudomonas sp. p50(2008)]MBF4554840.1 hypothetical protein [Pseudomonas sp. p50(2008)]